jgi:nucleoside-diphosphate-sugar epimerase
VKKILILGSEGFIGSHFVEHFMQLGWDVYGCDLFEAPTRAYHYQKVSRLSPELDEVFQKTVYDTCINAAGSGNVNYSMTHPFSDFESNALDTMKVLDAIRKNQAGCHYIHLSSAAVYGNPRQLPITEDAPLKPLSPYGWHKMLSEHLCLEYSSIYGLKTLAVRPFSVYGPGLRKQLLWDLFLKCKDAKNNVVELWGTGNESRDFIFIKDLVRCIHLLIDNGAKNGEVYNLASGIETTIREVAMLLVGQLNPEITISFNQMVREGDPLNWRADITRISRLNFKPAYSLEQGLKIVSQWMKDQK